MEQPDHHIERLPPEYAEILERIGSNAIRLAVRRPFCEVSLEITPVDIEVEETLIPYGVHTQHTDDQLADFKAKQDSIAVATARNVLAAHSRTQTPRTPASAHMFRSQRFEPVSKIVLETTSLAVHNQAGQLAAMRTFIWSADRTAAEGLDFTQTYPGKTIAAIKHVVRPINDERQTLWNATFRNTPETQKIRGKLFAGSPADEAEVDRLIEAALDFLHARHDVSKVEAIINKLREEAIIAMESRRLASETGADIPTLRTLERAADLTSQALAA